MNERGISCLCKLVETSLGENISAFAAIFRYGNSHRSLNVYRSLSNIYAHIDGVAGTTLVAASSLDKDLNLSHGGNIAAAAVGGCVAKKHR